MALGALVSTHIEDRANPTLSEIKTWPATVPLPQAAAAFGISRSYAYELAARGDFPARVIKRGRVTRVVTASVIAALEEPTV